jgi:broad specificity phosphatase PhoE
MLIIVRHGRTEANAAGRLQGRRLDPPLDDLGRRQASAAAAALPDAARVIASPLIRAQETAAAFGLPVETDERWIELDYGDLDGAPLTDVPAEVWSTWQADLDFTLPGGESLRALGQRVREGAESLVEDAARRDVVVVTHVSPLKAAVAWALGVGDEVAWRTFVAPASVTRIATGGPRLSLHGFNQTAHLADLA